MSSTDLVHKLVCCTDGMCQAGVSMMPTPEDNFAASQNQPIGKNRHHALQMRQKPDETL